MIPLKKKEIFFGSYQKITYIFYLFLFYPLFKLSYILTHDGPAHVFNVCLIKELVNGNILVSDFLHLKNFPEPNWSGHLIISFLNYFFRPNISEKIFLGLYLFFFPFFFNKLLKKINPNNGAMALLIFPFVYSYFFIGGLYNFLAGMTVLIASLSIILPLFENADIKKYLWISVFSVLLYFSHLITLGVFLVFILLSHLYCFRRENNSNYFSVFKFFLKRSIPLLISLLPSLVLLLVFLSNKKFLPENGSTVSILEMTTALIYISPIIVFQGYPENIYSFIIFVLLISLASVWVINLFVKSEKQPVYSKPFYQRSSFWAIASLLMLIFFFCIPDQAASGGVVKFRFELFFFLFLIAFICTLTYKKIIHIVIAIIIVPWMTLKFIYLFPKMEILDSETTTAMLCTDYIKENSILLPLNYSYNWLHCNLFNYAGTVKNIFVLDNYEASTLHFPLEWKKGRDPVEIMGNFNVDPPLCADIRAFEYKTGHLIDYIVVWEYGQLTDSCTLAIQSVISSGYHLIFHKDEKLKLYERN